jgi:hypothetical protein
MLAPPLSPDEEEFHDLEMILELLTDTLLQIIDLCTIARKLEQRKL